MSDTDAALPAQSQVHQHGSEAAMEPGLKSKMAGYQGSGKLSGRVTLISGGDSGIGRTVVIGFAKEGADVAVSWLDEREDAAETVDAIKAAGQRALSIPGDIGNPDFCRELVRQVIPAFGRTDVLVNNAAEQHLVEDFEDITNSQIGRTFWTNIFGPLFLTCDCLQHVTLSSAIINSASVTAYKGSAVQMDSASTKGALVAFTGSLALALVKRGIRVNAVAPGPVWTPLISASYDAEKTSYHGEAVLMERPGQSDEIASSYIFPACKDSS